MCDPRNFLCCGLFWFCFIFSLRGASTMASPSAAVVSDCALLPSLDCNHSKLQWSEWGDDVSKHKGPRWQAYTRGLGCLLIGWSCQNKFALLVPKFKFQPGEPRRKSCFTSKAPRTSHFFSTSNSFQSNINHYASTAAIQVPCLFPFHQNLLAPSYTEMLGGQLSSALRLVALSGLSLLLTS